MNLASELEMRRFWPLHFGLGTLYPAHGKPEQPRSTWTTRRRLYGDMGMTYGWRS